MRREGRQHGMVRTYRILPSPWNPRPKSRFIQQFESPPTAGLFTKVSTKPTNHSKFTGKCGKSRCVECHMTPTCKSRDKSKGSRKLKSSEMICSTRLITWRVVDGMTGFNDSGFSTSSILNHLSNDYDHDHDHDDIDDDDSFKVNPQPLGEMEDYEGEIEENILDHNKDDDDDGVHVHNDDDDDDDVRFVLDNDLEEEGWCLVGAI